MPEVSIVMPLYNEENYVAQSIAALLAQDFEDFELLVADNASTDRTMEIGAGFAARDSRVTIYGSDSNRGAIWNFNRLLPVARGRFVMWAAGHDDWAPNFLTACLAAHHADPLVALVYPRTRWIDLAGATIVEKGEGIGTDRIGAISRFNTVLWRTMKCTAIYGLIRRSVLDRTHAMTTHFGSDFVLLAELACYGRIVELPAVLFSRRETRPSESKEEIAQRICDSLLPKNGSRRRRFPYWELSLALPRMVLSADLPVATKLVMLASLGVFVPTKYGPRVLQDIKRALR